MFFSRINFNKLSPLETVKAVYELLLERKIDAAGLDLWTSAIEKNTFSRAKLLDMLFLSREFLVVQDSINRKERLKRALSVLDLLKVEHAEPMHVAQALYRMVFNRKIDDLGVSNCQAKIDKGRFTVWRLMLRMLKSKEFRKPYLRPRPSKRLHAARMAWVTQIPAAKRILDIGGSSPSLPEGALIELGYSHRPEKLIIFDKPPQEQYWGTPGYSQDNIRNFSWGQVEYVHGYAEDIVQNTDLSAQKFDMIFMGQVVEHIYEDKLPCVLAWIKDHLNEQGAFYFDTPNRSITQYETGNDRYIDPDHKREYTPEAFAALLRVAGFSSIQQWGVLDMPHVVSSQSFGVEDYYGAALLSPNPENAYCFAMAGRA